MVDRRAILVDNISKRYRIGQGGQAPYQTLRESLVRTIQAPFRYLETGRNKRKMQMIWALKDVSFEILHGQAVGIIGRNGAGKSTLLKVLSRITPPTHGTVDLYGRVGSLLEVGTGFHPELTGRENIFLNGAILGMKRTEIGRKFDEMVAFAEFEQFIDTPVKYYSSGMYMRLAFSVAAHLETEILLVDEVLAVGDLAFQKKAIGKMGDVTREGRTILFVSHNLDAIIALTTRGIVLNSGLITFDGLPEEAIQHYRKSMIDIQEVSEFNDIDKKTGLLHAKVVTSEENGIHRFGEKLEFEFEVSLDQQIVSFEFAFQVLNEKLQPIINPRWVDIEREYAMKEKVTLRCILPTPRLYKGRYSLRTFLGDRSSGVHYETVDSICEFELVMDGVPNPSVWVPDACAYIDDVEWRVYPNLRLIYK